MGSQRCLLLWAQTPLRPERAKKCALYQRARESGEDERRRHKGVEKREREEHRVKRAACETDGVE